MTTPLSLAKSASTRSRPPRNTKLYERYIASCPLRIDFNAQVAKSTNDEINTLANQVEIWARDFSSTTGPNALSLMSATPTDDNINENNNNNNSNNNSNMQRGSVTTGPTTTSRNENSGTSTSSVATSDAADEFSLLEGDGIVGDKRGSSIELKLTPDDRSSSDDEDDYSNSDFEEEEDDGDAFTKKIVKQRHHPFADQFYQHYILSSSSANAASNQNHNNKKKKHHHHHSSGILFITPPRRLLPYSAQKQIFVFGLKALIREAKRRELEIFDYNNRQTLHRRSSSSTNNNNTSMKKENSNQNNITTNTNNNNDQQQKAGLDPYQVTALERKNIICGWNILISCLDTALEDGGGGEPAQVLSVIVGFGCWYPDLPSPSFGRRPDAIIEMYRRLVVMTENEQQQQQQQQQRNGSSSPVPPHPKAKQQSEPTSPSSPASTIAQTTEFIAECLMAFDRLHREETGRPHVLRHVSQTEFVWNSNCPSLSPFVTNNNTVTHQKTPSPSLPKNRTEKAPRLLTSPVHITLLTAEKEFDCVTVPKCFSPELQLFLQRINRQKVHLATAFPLAGPMDPNSRYVGFSREVRQIITLSRIRSEQLRRRQQQQQQQHSTAPDVHSDQYEEVSENEKSTSFPVNTVFVDSDHDDDDNNDNDHNNNQYGSSYSSASSSTTAVAAARKSNSSSSSGHNSCYSSSLSTSSGSLSPVKSYRNNNNNNNNQSSSVTKINFPSSSSGSASAQCDYGKTDKANQHNRSYEACFDDDEEEEEHQQQKTKRS